VKPDEAVAPSKRANGEDTPPPPVPPQREVHVMNFIGDFTESIMPIMVFSIPIVAIVGGITMGIVRTMTQSRIIENAQRERIAAIQAGIDPSKLPPIPNADFNEMADAARDPELAQRRRTNGLMVGGVVTLFTGIGLSVFFLFMDAGENTWAIGVIPGFIGIALLLSAFLVRPRGGI
jgi:hypothetical protein